MKETLLATVTVVVQTVTRTVATVAVEEMGIIPLPPPFIVAVGASGTVLRSFDNGTNWTAVDSGTLENLINVTSDGTTIVAVGENTTIIISNDGNEWQPTHKRTSGKALHDVTYDANNNFFAVGSDGLLLTTNAITTIAPWTASSVGTQFFSVIASDGNNLSAGGYRTLYTDQGGSWQPAVVNGNDFTFTGSVWDIAYGNSAVVAVGKTKVIMVSTDGGASWALNKKNPATGNFYSPQNLQGVATNGSVFVAVGDSGTIIRSSEGGVSWDVKSNNPTNNAQYTTEILKEVVTDGSTWVIVGKAGSILTSSDDGETWDMRNSETTEDLQGVVFHLPR